jgi:hypothetical protein
MRACRTEARGRAGIIAALLMTAMLAGPAPATAQTGAPVPLLPSQPSPAAGGAGAAAEPPAGGTVTAAPLAPTDASWVGVLSSDQGALPQTMWSGTPRALVATALPLLAPSISPALQDLTRRLLLSNADAPAGAEPPDRPPLAEIRLGRLLALGHVAGAVAMMNQLPSDPSGDTLDRMRIELDFAANDASSACAAVQTLIARYQSPWWQRALIACQALAGDGAKASLGQSLLREQKVPRDPVFDALIDMLTGGRPRRIDKLPDPTPLRLALLAAAKRPLPEEALAAAGPAALLAYATSTAPSLEQRLPAAERAALEGALPADRLGALYDQVAATPEQQEAALRAGKLPRDARNRAILYQVARSTAPAATRMAAITALIADAEKRDALPVTAPLLIDAIGALQPQDASADFAGQAARALLVAGAGDAAAPWIAAAGSKELAVVSRLVVPPAGAVDTAALLHDAVAELVSRDSRAAPAQADLLVALFAAFDTPLAVADWEVLLAPSHRADIPSAALWIDQQQAASAKRVGETVLATVLLLQAGDRLSLEPIVLTRAIQGLRAIGHESDARRLALEAAIDAGL